MTNDGLHMDRAEADNIADRLEDDMGRPTRDIFRVAKDRLGFAGVAMNIAEDRYSAGSTAARATLIIALRHGIGAAEDFMADLAHHEGA